MISLKLINLQDGVFCNSQLFQSKESFMRVSTKLQGGNAVGLISDFGCGAWGLATCLCGRCVQPIGEIWLNDKHVECKELQKYSCVISENLFACINSDDNLLTPRKCIDKALSLSGLSYKTNDIKNIFCLSDQRFDKELEYISGEIWNVSVAIGFALGREIFCFPWLNQRDITRFNVMHEQGIISFLKDNKKIILIPSSQKYCLIKKCDYLIEFKKNKVIYYKGLQYYKK